MSALTLQYCYAGGTFTDCVWQKNSGAAAGNVVAVTDIAGFSFVRNKVQSMVIMGNVGAYSYSLTRAKNCTFTDTTIILGMVAMLTCDNVNFTGTIFCGAPSGTTVTTYATYVWLITLNTIDCTFSGLTWPVTIPIFTPASCPQRRPLGHQAAQHRHLRGPLTMGSVNICGLVYVLATYGSGSKSSASMSQ